MTAVAEAATERELAAQAGVVIDKRCDNSAQATASARPSHTSRKKMRQRRSLRRSRSSSRAASSKAPSRRVDSCGAGAAAAGMAPSS